MILVVNYTPILRKWLQQPKNAIVAKIFIVMFVPIVLIYIALGFFPNSYWIDVFTIWIVSLGGSWGLRKLFKL